MIWTSSPSDPAAAQTTICRWIGQTFSCTTPPPPPAPIMPSVAPSHTQLTNPADVSQGVMDSFRRGQEQAAEMERQRLELAAIRAQQEASSAPVAQPVAPQQTFTASLDDRKAIGVLLRGGDCPDAIAMALDTGDIELAKNVQAFCNDMHSENPSH